MPNHLSSWLTLKFKTRRKSQLSKGNSLAPSALTLGAPTVRHLSRCTLWMRHPARELRAPASTPHRPQPCSPRARAGGAPAICGARPAAAAARVLTGTCCSRRARFGCVARQHNILLCGHPAKRQGRNHRKRPGETPTQPRAPTPLPRRLRSRCARHRGRGSAPPRPHAVACFLLPPARPRRQVGSRGPRALLASCPDPLRTWRARGTCRVRVPRRPMSRSPRTSGWLARRPRTSRP